MKARKVWRYRCDFCKKSSCSKFHMERHEKGCTNNPNRICSMHQWTDGTQKSLAELSAILIAKGPECEKDLRDAADNCPACILAALRQTKGLDVEDFGSCISIGFPFDFKTEVAKFWSEANERNADY